MASHTSANGDPPTPANGVQLDSGYSPSINRALSDRTLDTSIDTASDRNSPGGSSHTQNRPNRNATRNSAAYVRNYRLSRYRNALNTAIPFRRTTITGTEELPVDSIGCFSTCSFAWVRHYHIRAPLRPKKDKKKKTQSTVTSELPTTNSPTDGSPADPGEPAEKPNPMPMLPRVTVADSCEVNAKRLLGLYKYEEQSNGRINGSMLRVAWQFCRTRVLVAALLQTLAHLSTVLMVALFMRIIMETVNESWQRTTNNSTSNMFRRPASWTTDEQLRIGFCSAAVVISFLATAFLRSASNSMSLRTAMRLRTACIGAAFSKSLKSSMQNNVAAHQIVALCADESELISALVVKGPYLLAHSLGLVFCTIAAMVTLGAPGMWPIFSIFGIVMLGAIAATISSLYYRRSQSFLSKKLTIVEEYFNSFNVADYLNQHESFKNRFSSALSAQYLALSKAELFRPTSASGLTLVVLLGGTFLVWCDLHIVTENTAMSNLMVMWALLVPTLVAEICEAFQAVAQGINVLNKVKNAIILSAPELPKMRPTRDLKISVADATFRWDRSLIKSPAANNNEMGVVDDKTFALDIDSLNIPKNQLIGITGAPGSGKTSLIYALLGHLNLRVGEFYQRDKCSFYPEYPYTMDGGTLKENILFGDEWDERRYSMALQLTQLNFNAGFDETPIEHVLDLLLLQKISLARALYSDRDSLILEEPLSAHMLESDLSEIFEVVTDKMREMGKTIIVVSQNEKILSHCQRIFLLSDGKSSGFVEYTDAQRTPDFQHVLQNYKACKSAEREDMHTQNSNLISTTLNISTEDLVTVETDDAVPENPMLVSHFQTFLLICLTVMNALIFVTLPFFIAIYITGHLSPSPWFALIVFVLVPIIFTTNLLVKHFVNKIGRRFNKNVQRRIFAKLLNSSIADKQETQLSMIMHTMMDNNLIAFQVRTQTIYIWCVVLFACLMSLSTNTFVFLVIGLPTLDFMFRFCQYWRVVQHYGRLESETRQKLLHLVANQLKGRVVIQSFDNVQKFRSKIYKAVEENSAALLICKATTFYNQWYFMIWQAITLSLLMLVLCSTSYVQDIQLIFDLYVFMLVIAQMSQLLDLRFSCIMADQKLYQAHRYLQTKIFPDISTLQSEA